MNNGWIKLYRKLRENPIYSNSKALHCWIECLLRANHQKDKFYLGRKQIELNSGEFIFGRDEFGKSINVSGSTAWFWLQRFEVDRMIDIKKTSKGCLCSIINWKDYQEVDSKVDNKKTANKQQINTDKNNKNDKNDKNMLADKSADEVNLILQEFYTVNPTLNFGNTTQRKIIEELINKWGYDKTLNTVKYAVAIQGKQYSPVITSPLQLKNKMGDLFVFNKKANTSSKFTSI